MGQFGQALHLTVDRIVNMRLRATEYVGDLLDRQKASEMTAVSAASLSSGREAYQAGVVAVHFIAEA
jgi:hypothetical protein